MSLSRKKELLLVAKKASRRLRQRSTNAEVLLWNVVRNRQFMGKKFRRQHPLFHDVLGRESFYVADFYCHELKLVIEVDGGIHEEQRDRDMLRSAILNYLGITVVRFTNEEVEDGMARVLKTLKAAVRPLESTPAPERRRGRG